MQFPFTVVVQPPSRVGLRRLLCTWWPWALGGALPAVFLGVAVLVLTLKIPGLMRQHAGDGLGFARYLVYRQAARAIEGRSRAQGGA